MLSQGASHEELVDDYPDLEEKDILACIAYAHAVIAGDSLAQVSVRFFALAGRITRSARRITLHLPKRWPWETQFSRALARLRAIPLPA